MAKTALQDFDEETDGAAAALAAYEEIVDFNLSLSPFSTFAMEVRQLSHNTLGVPLDSGYDYVFNIPGPGLVRRFGSAMISQDPDRRFTRYILTANQVSRQCKSIVCHGEI
ncbi:MAG: hypothetical protein U5K75_08540 [Ahrensia sp.]|nr:hypothetical protein [Ahrensia sp.]